MRHRSRGGGDEHRISIIGARIYLAAFSHAHMTKSTSPQTHCQLFATAPHITTTNAHDHAPAHCTFEKRRRRHNTGAWRVAKKPDLITDVYKRATRATAR